MAAPQKQTQKVGGFEFVAGGRRGPSTARQPTASSNEAVAPAALPGTGKRARKDYSDREDDELERNAGGPAKFAKIADEDEEAGSVAVGEPDFSALVAEGSNSTERLRSLLSSALRISLAHLEANGHSKPDQAIVSAAQAVIEKFGARSGRGSPAAAKGEGSPEGGASSSSSAGSKGGLPSQAASSSSSSSSSNKDEELLPHPKNIEHAARAAQLEQSIAALKAEAEQWKGVKSKLQAEAKAATALIVPAKKKAEDKKHEKDEDEDEEDDDEDLISSSDDDDDDDENEYERDLLSKLPSFGRLQRVLDQGVPGAFFAVDAMARALNRTGQVIDAAPDAAAKASKVIRGAAFKGLDLIGQPTTSSSSSSSSSSGSAAGSVAALLAGKGAASGLSSTSAIVAAANAGRPIEGFLPGPSRTPGKGGKSAAAAARAGANKDKDELPPVAGEEEEEEESDEGGQKHRGPRPSVPDATPAILKMIKKGPVGGGK